MCECGIGHPVYERKHSGCTGDSSMECDKKQISYLSQLLHGLLNHLVTEFKAKKDTTLIHGSNISFSRGNCYTAPSWKGVVCFILLYQLHMWCADPEQI